MALASAVRNAELRARPSIAPALVLVGLPVTILGLAWTMGRSSYDIWGAFWVAPVLLLLTAPIANHLAKQDGDRSIVRIVMFSALLKVIVGAMARYWMAFDLYEGNADAGGYHRIGAELAPLFRSGIYDNLGQISGTRFIE